MRTSSAPLLIAIIEVEGPTRALMFARSDADERALRVWIDADPDRRALVAAALAAEHRGGGFARGRRWSRALARGERGPAWLAEQLIAAHRRIRELEAIAGNDRSPL